MPVVSSKISDTQREAVRAEAAKRNMSVSEFLKYTIEMEGNIEPIAKRVIADLCAQLEIKPSEFLEILCINYAAILEGYRRAGLNQVSWTSPFLVDDRGKLAKGQELFVYLIKRYLKAFLREDSQREQLADAILTLETESMEPFAIIN